MHFVDKMQCKSSGNSIQ